MTLDVVRAAAPAAAPPADQDVVVEKDIEYARAGGIALKLDLYRPKDPPKSPMPAIIWLHGGGWSAGARQWMPPQWVPRNENAYWRHGYCLVAIEYRLSGQAIFPAAVADCKCAVRWVRQNAGRYGIDPNRIGVMGYSAGGNLALMVGCAQDRPELEGQGGNPDISSRVQAVCSIAGPTDMTAFTKGGEGEKAASGYCGGTPTQKPAICQQASPITYAAKDNPPILLIHGEADGTVPIAQAENMAKRLKDVGAGATFIRIRNYTHTQAVGKQDPAMDEIQKAILAFFDAALKAAAPPKAEPQP